MGRCEWCGWERQVLQKCNYCGGYYCDVHVLPEFHECELRIQNRNNWNEVTQSIETPFIESKQKTSINITKWFREIGREPKCPNCIFSTKKEEPFVYCRRLNGIMRPRRNCTFYKKG